MCGVAGESTASRHMIESPVFSGSISVYLAFDLEEEGEAFSSVIVALCTAIFSAEEHVNRQG